MCLPGCCSLCRSRGDRSCRIPSNSCCKLVQTCPRCPSWGPRRSNWAICECGSSPSCPEELVVSSWLKIGISALSTKSCPASSLKLSVQLVVFSFSKAALPINECLKPKLGGADRSRHTKRKRKGENVFLPFSRILWVSSVMRAAHENK